MAKKPAAKPAESTAVAEVASGFLSQGTSELATTQLTSAAAAVEAEIQSSLVIAKRFPRDEQKAYVSVMESCKRPTFAEKGQYVFNRAGTEIRGPSVHMARECGRLWGNLRYGYEVTDVDHVKKTTTVSGYCWDLQTNSKNSSGVTFKNEIKRGGRMIEPDERDYRELVAKNGSIASRNAILQVIPADLIEDAMRQLRETSVKAASGELKMSKKDWLRNLLAAWNGYGVTREMIEAQLKCSLEDVTAKQAADLKGKYKSIEDGQAKVSEFFKPVAKPSDKPKNLADVAT